MGPDEPQRRDFPRGVANKGWGSTPNPGVAGSKFHAFPTTPGCFLLPESGISGMALTLRQDRQLLGVGPACGQ